MKPEALIGPIIFAIGLVAAALIYVVANALISSDGGVPGQRFDALETKVNEQEQIIEDLSRQNQQLQERLIDLVNQVDVLEQRSRVDPPQASPSNQPNEDAIEALRISKRLFNLGLKYTSNTFMLDRLGHPRVAKDYAENCTTLTNERLKARMETRAVGPIRATMLKPALDSLAEVFSRFKELEPELHDALGTAGGLCVRFVRNSRTAISNHSWGTAIDLKLRGDLDRQGDGRTQSGLIFLAQEFNKAGWYWGAGYRHEDSMHFEASQALVERWIAEGSI
ncbi:MAG: M15 family metallopeptidase [Pseudomonadota bacterium]